MKLNRTLRSSAVACVVGALVVGTAPAEAAPPRKIGPVAGLEMNVAPATGAGYTIGTDWDDLAGATRYTVKMVDGANTTLAAATVHDSEWSGATTLPAGTRISVTVTPYADKRRGRSATVAEVLPDVTAPRAAYTVVRDLADPSGGSVTIRRDELTDDVSPLSGLTQTIAWDEGQQPQPWPSSQVSVTHDYGNQERVHHPVVTVTDQAGNSATYRLAVAVRDGLAPQGAFEATTASAFARWTQVGLTELQVSDNLSVAQDVTRTVDWGDGTVEAWTPGLSHVYAVAGGYLPRVRLTDEAGNASPWISTTAVQVTADTTAPATTLRVPRRSMMSRIAGWSTLRGRLDDGEGVGEQAAAVKVVQLRRGAWYGYRSATGTWVKAATRTKALRAASGTAQPTATHTWSLPVKGLRTGTLVVRYRGLDLLGNATPWLVREQRLTRR